MKSLLIILLAVAALAAFYLGRITSPAHYQLGTLSMSQGVQYPVRVDLQAGTMEMLQPVGALREVFKH